MHRLAATTLCAAALACGGGKGAKKDNASSEVPLGPALVGVAVGAGVLLARAADQAGLVSFDTKKEQCEAVVAAMNRAVQAVGRVQSNSPSGTGALRAIATQFDQSAGELAALQLSDPTLVAKRNEYVTMLREAAAASREMASAVDALDTTRINAAQNKLSTATGRESLLVDSINQYCATK